MIHAIRPAVEPDLDALTRIAHTAKRHWGYPESWIEAWRRDLTITVEDLSAQDIFVAHDEQGEVLGFAALLRDAECVHLEHLWVDPSAMGTGVGRGLFEEALRRAREGDARSLEIDSDPYAVEFYRHLGAVECGSVDAPMEGVSRTRPQLRVDLAAS